MTRLRQIRGVYAGLLLLTFLLAYQLTFAVRHPSPFSFGVFLRIIVNGALCLYFLFFSVRFAITDWKCARGSKCIERTYNIAITRDEAAWSLGPIKGSGRAQFRIIIRRIANTASGNEMQISKVPILGTTAENAFLRFASAEEKFEANILEQSEWAFDLKVTPTKSIIEPFIGKMRLVCYCVSNDVIIPESSSG